MVTIKIALDCAYQVEHRRSLITILRVHVLCLVMQFYRTYQNKDFSKVSISGGKKHFRASSGVGIILFDISHQEDANRRVCCNTNIVYYLTRYRSLKLVPSCV